MLYVLTIHPIHPTKLKETLESLKPLVRPRFLEQPIPQGLGGRPRQWPRWLIVVLTLIGVSLNWSWAKNTDEFKECESALHYVGAKCVPGKTSLFDAGESISET